MASYWKRLTRCLGVLTVIAFLVAAFTPAINAIGGRLAVQSAVAPAGAIVVIGASVLHGGILQEESMRRAVWGIELYKKGLAPLIVLCGTGRPEQPTPTEADVRSRLAVDLGVPADAILKVDTAKTTQEESLHVAAMLHPRNVNRIVLVTESLHMRRAKLVFERAGFEVWPAISADYTTTARSPEQRLWLTMRVMQESAALIYYRIAGYI